MKEILSCEPILLIRNKKLHCISNVTMFTCPLWESVLSGPNELSIRKIFFLHLLFFIPVWFTINFIISFDASIFIIKYD
jgi:hypothetical protein